MHVGGRHRCAEKVIRVDGELHFFANGGETLRALHADFELRLLVFRNFKIAARFRFAERRRDVIGAQRRFVSDVQLAAETAAGGKRQLLLENFAVVWIFDRDVDRFAVDEFVTVASPVSQNAFEENLLRRPVDRTIGVDVTGQLLAGERVVFAAFAAEIERLDIGDHEVVPVVRHDQIGVLRRGRGIDVFRGLIG